MIYAKIDLSTTEIETLQRQVYFDTVRERFNQQFNDKRVWMQYDWSNGETLLGVNSSLMLFKESCKQKSIAEIKKVPQKLRD